MTSSKTKVIKIKFTKKEQEEIDKINKGEKVPTVRTIVDKKTGVKRDIITNHKFTYEMGKKRLVELYGGLCSFCRDWPLYKVMVDVGDAHQGAWLVSRYCQGCYDKRGIKK